MSPYKKNINIVFSSTVYVLCSSVIFVGCPFWLYLACVPSNGALFFRFPCGVRSRCGLLFLVLLWPPVLFWPPLLGPAVASSSRSCCGLGPGPLYGIFVASFRIVIVDLAHSYTAGFLCRWFLVLWSVMTCSSVLILSIGFLWPPVALSLLI